MTKRTGVRIVIGLGMALAAIVLAVWFGVRTVWFREWARDEITTRVNNTITGQLTIGSMSGSLFRDVTLHDVVLSDSDGPILTARTIEASYDILSMFSGDIPIDDLILTGPVVSAVSDGRGWNVARLARATDAEGGGRGIVLRHIRIVDGAVDVVMNGERHVSASLLEFSGSMATGNTGTSVGVDRLTLVDHRSGQPLEASATRLTFDDAGTTATGLRVRTTGLDMAADVRVPEDGAAATLDVRVGLERWTAATWAVYLPSNLASLPGLTGDFTARGPADALRTEWNLRLNEATSSGALVSDVTVDRPSVRGALAVRDLDPADLIADSAVAGRVSAELDLDATIDLEAPMRSRAAFRLRGGSVDVTGYAAEHISAEGLLEGEAVRARIAARAYGARTQVDVRVSDVANRTRRALAATGRIVALDVSRLPIAQMPAITTSLTGRFEAHMAPRTWSATFEAEESRLGDGVIEAGSIVRARTQARALHASVSARVQNVSSAMLPDPPAAPTTVTGVIEGNFSIPDLDAPELLDVAAGRVQATLGESAVMGTAITRADIDASLAAGVLTVTTMKVQAPSGTLESVGTLAVGAATDATSDLQIELGFADLSTLPADLIAGLRGGVQVTATIAGTSALPTAAGTFNLREPGYTDVADALSLSGRFNATLPDRDPERVTADVEVDGTFVTVRDQEIQAAKVVARYEARQLELWTRLDQPKRSLEINGGLTLFPDYQEVQLRELTVSGLGDPWRLDAGDGPATIRYGTDDVRISDLAIVRGAERIQVAGVVGLPESTVASDLSVALEHLDVADLMTIATGNSVVRGTASGSIRLTGAMNNPDATASVSVVEGAVADVPFTRARADVELTERVAAITARVEENSGATFDIDGTVPVGGEADAPLDVRVQGPSVSLGLLASLTSHLSEISGTAAIDVRATGTLADPTLAGTVAVADGALTIVPTGVRYEGIDIGVRLDGDAMVIERASLADTDGHTLTMTGGATLLTSGEQRTVAVDVSASGLRLLDNELGEVEATIDARIDGRLTSPSVTGRVTINQGRVEIDELLPRLATTPDPAVVVPTPGAPATAVVAAEVAPPVTTAASAATLTQDDRTVGGALADAGPVAGAVIDLQVTLPDNVVLRGSNIRTGTGGLGLGDMNLTVGGTVAVRRSNESPMRVVGAIEVVRGFYEFQGRRFDVEEGSTIRFRGGDAIEPALDVTAEREVSGIVARVALTGTAARPRISLSSNPPLDEGDVMSLIVFNQPMSQLGESEQVDLVDRAGQMALGAVASGLADSIGRALDVDLFEINVPSTEGSGDVMLGTQLNERLFVGFRQEFGSDRASRLSFEYRLTEFLRILTAVGQGGDRGQSTRDRETAGADLVFRFRY